MQRHINDHRFILSCSMNMKRFIFTSAILICSLQNFAQPVLKEVLKANRDKVYRNLIKNTVNAKLSVALTDSTEDKWEDAFRAMELIHYRSPWTDNKIRSAFTGILEMSPSFQRSLIEVCYTIYPNLFTEQVKKLLQETDDAKILAMCASYLLKADTTESSKIMLKELSLQRLSTDPGNVTLEQLVYQTDHEGKEIFTPSIHTFLEKKYLPGNVLLISFQRRNRDYPGLVIVRDANGNFIKDDYGNYFNVPQLARSISNLPGYLSNGNTPQGIFRMYGTDQSKSIFIGPTVNIQLTMPFENTAGHFFSNSSLDDTAWGLDRYKKLLPVNFRDYYPAFQTYYAGKAGRTEIIAHGTTIDPFYYKDKPYYPLTPTQGCLCTKEIWNETTGSLQESDQQVLANAIVKAGGPFGYAIVIEIDDRQEPVTINDIIPFLKLAMQK